MEVRLTASRPPVTCTADAPAAIAARLMNEHDIGFVVIVDDARRVVGVVTDRDLAIRLVGAGKPAATRVGEIMSDDVVSVREDRPLVDTARQMAVRRVRRLPVVDEADRVVGVVALDDVVRDSVDALEEAARLVRGHGPRAEQAAREILGKPYAGRTTITG